MPGEVGRVGTAVAGGLGELLGEERVALGPPGDELDDVVVEGRAGAAHDPPQVGVGQRPEVDPGEPREARPHGEGAGQRVPPVPCRSQASKNSAGGPFTMRALAPLVRWMRFTRLSNGTRRHHAP